MPVDRIVQALKPTDALRVASYFLNDATTKAAGLLKANCPQEQVLTPPGRVASMEQRLRTMLEAVKMVEPELDAFYGLLTDEQKARFNQLGAGGRLRHNIHARRALAHRFARLQTGAPPHFVRAIC